MYKFRGKRVDTGEWAYGSYLYSKDFTGSVPEIVDSEGNPHIVHPESVGMRIGARDKNGKGMYAGDVVKSNIGWRATIEFCNASFGYHDSVSQWLPLCLWKNLCFLEVIGNTTDNPELLK